MKALGPIAACACVDCHYLKDVQKNLLNFLRSAMPTTATRGKHRNIKITNLKPDLFKKHITIVSIFAIPFLVGFLHSVFYRLHNQWLHRPRCIRTISEAFVLGDDHGGLLLLQRDDLSVPRRCWGEGPIYLLCDEGIEWQNPLQNSHLRSLLPKLYCRGISNCT